MTFGEQIDCRLERWILPRYRAMAARCAAEVHHRRRCVDPENLAAVCAQDLRRELTEQPEPNDTNKLAQFRIRLPHPLHRNGAKCRESRTIQCHGVRNLCYKILRHRHDPRM